MTRTSAITALTLFLVATSSSAAEVSSPANSSHLPATEWLNFRLSVDELSGGNGGSYLTPEADWTPAFISGNGYRFMPRLGVLAIKSEDNANHQGFVAGGIFEADFTDSLYIDGSTGLVKFAGYSGSVSVGTGLGCRLGKSGLMRDIFFDFENYDIGNDPTFVLKLGITIGFF